MQTFAILGFTFGLIAFAMVSKLNKEFKNLKKQMEDIEKRLSAARDLGRTT